jgi:hypothetical protein
MLSKHRDRYKLPPSGKFRGMWLKVGLECTFNCVELSRRRTFPTDVPNPVRGCMFIDTLRPESTSGRICEAAFPGSLTNSAGREPSGPYL